MPHPTLAPLRVLLTRPPGQGSDEWAAALRAAGAEPLQYPTLTVVPPSSWEAVDRALARLADYDFLIFTSQTTVAALVGRLPEGRFPSSVPVCIAAVGPATRRAVEKAGGVVSVVPADNRQEGMVEALRALAPGKRVLLPIAAGGRSLLAESLRSWGCDVEVLTVYGVIPKQDLAEPPPFDAAVFASPSALRAYLAVARSTSLVGKIVTAIGQTTGREAAANGIQAIVAESPDVHAVIRALAQARNQGDS